MVLLVYKVFFFVVCRWDMSCLLCFVNSCNIVRKLFLFEELFVLLFLCFCRGIFCFLYRMIVFIIFLSNLMLCWYCVWFCWFSLYGRDEDGILDVILVVW